MQFDIITIFPEAFSGYLGSSIIARAQKKKKIKIALHNLRRWTTDKHKSVDDSPYGGGVGMVMKVDPIAKAVAAIKKRTKPRVILLSAKGAVFTQQRARQLAKYNQLIFICGHYEGIDERVARYVADEEVSIGEYVLTGGELGAMVVLDAVTRLIPGVLGKDESSQEESFSEPHVREYPHYTRPQTFVIAGKKRTVPAVLLSGNHAKIQQWRAKHKKVLKSR